MRHRVYGKKLGRDRNQRQALFRSQLKEVFTHGFIKTTDTKVKAITPLVERVCTLAKKNTLAARRRIFRSFQDIKLVNSVVTQINELYPDITSNFTRVSKIKRRQGDDALIVKLYLFNGIAPKVKAESESKESASKPKNALQKLIKKPAPKTPKKDTKTTAKKVEQSKK